MKWGREILYINTYIWNPEMWYWWTHLQGSNGDTGIENRLVGTVQEGEGGTERSMGTYMLPCVKQQTGIRCVTQGAQLSALWQHGGRGRSRSGREAREGGDPCIPVADSCWCVAETSATLQSSCPPIKKSNVCIVTSLYCTLEYLLRGCCF